MLLGKQYGVEAWMSHLELEDCFDGYPGWVKQQAWGYFTPHEQKVLERWRTMHDAVLLRQWRRRQARRNRR